MTTDHRKANILVELLNSNVNTLAASLATVVEERDALKAEVADLKAKLSPSPEAPPAPVPPQ